MKRDAIASGRVGHECLRVVGMHGACEKLVTVQLGKRNVWFCLFEMGKSHKF